MPDDLARVTARLVRMRDDLRAAVADGERRLFALQNRLEGVEEAIAVVGAATPPPRQIEIA